MHSTYPVARLSDGTAPAIHAYFDLSPESPNGAHVLHFRFAGSAPGPGELVITDRAGGNARVVGTAPHGSAHNGVLQQWVDDRTVVSVVDDGGAMHSVLSSLDGTAERTLPGAIRMFSPVRQAGLALRNGTRDAGFQPGDEAVYLVDIVTREARRLFGRDEVAQFHPRPAAGTAISYFQNSKWSPDSTRFFVVFTNERHTRNGGDTPYVKSLILAEADGSQARYLAEFGHHPMWGGDGTFLYAFVLNPAGGQDLVVFPLDGQPAYPLLHGIPGVHATLSPDGALLVTDAFDCPAPDQGSILLVDVKSGERRTLATFALPDHSHDTGYHPHPVWSRDGRRVYFNAADARGVPQLYAVDL